MARIFILGLIGGGVCGAGVGMGIYPPLVGVSGAVLVSGVVGVLIYRTRHNAANARPHDT